MSLSPVIASRATATPGGNAFHISSINFADDMYSCLDGAEALVIATEWPQFANADLAEIRKRLRTPLVFDGRNLLDPDSAAGQGLEYYSVGRSPTQATAKAASVTE